MPIYSVFLTTYTGPSWNNGVPVNAGTLNAVRWNLNWDDIFRMENKKYKHCRVRMRLQMSSWAAVATDWDTYNGYLACNLQSISSGGSTYGTLLGQTHVQDVPTTGTAVHCMVLDTTDGVGVDVVPPYGNQDFTLTFNRMALDSGLRISNIYDYNIVLYFELYDEI